MRSIVRSRFSQVLNLVDQYKTAKFTNAVQKSQAKKSNLFASLRENLPTEETRLHQNSSLLHSEPSEFDKNINILSYNIFIRPPFVHNNGNDFKDERLSAFMDQMHSYDIICLQELFGAFSNKRSNFLAKAQEKGFCYNTVSPIPNPFTGQIVDGGLAILSRYPIQKAEFCPFPSGIGVDYLAQKGALYAKVNIGSSVIHLYTLHTQATYDTSMKYPEKRSEQFKVLRNFVQNTLLENEYKETDSVLLTGDFNVDSRSDRLLNNIAIGTESNNLYSDISEYEALMNCLTNNSQDEIEDLVLKASREHPITFGDYYLAADNNTKMPVETILTHKEALCSNERLDYIFSYKPTFDTNRSSKNMQDDVILNPISANVEKFHIEHDRFSQLSDHYGVKVVMKPTKYIQSSLMAAQEAINHAET